MMQGLHADNVVKLRHDIRKIEMFQLATGCVATHSVCQLPKSMQKTRHCWPVLGARRETFRCVTSAYAFKKAPGMMPVGLVDVGQQETCNMHLFGNGLEN